MQGGEEMIAFGGFDPCSGKYDVVQNTLEWKYFISLSTEELQLMLYQES